MSVEQKFINETDKKTRGVFLRDVLICSLGAYGGPEAHVGVFVDQLVTKKQYLTEQELIELVASWIPENYNDGIGTPSDS